MSDLIDRWAAIALIHSLYPSAPIMRMNRKRWEKKYEPYIEAEKALEQMPSAQPEPCEDAVSRNAIIQKLNTMDRYVSEELVLCDTDKRFPKNEVFIVDDVYEEIVENLPSAQPDLSGYSDRLWKAAYERGKAEAQPDIIHCGECKHRDPEDHKCDCGHDILWQLPRDDEWYCADAERKEGEADEQT